MVPLLMFVLFGSLSQVACNHTLRSIQARSRDVYTSVVGNYVAAVTLAAAYLLLRGPQSEAWLNAVGMGVLTGFFYTAALLAIIRNMGQRGMAMTGALVGTSQIVPVLLAIVLGERPSHQQVAGIIAAGAALPLLSLATVSGSGIRERPSLSLAALLFLLQGGAMSGNLVATKVLPPASMPTYLVALFGSGLALSLCARAWAGKGPGAGDARRGAFFGMLNMASTLIIISALACVSGAIFFAAMGTLALAATTLLGVWLWHERLQVWGWAGLGLSAIAAPLLVLK